MTEKTTDTLTDALSRIMSAVGRIEKKGMAPQAMGGFRFVREADVVEALQEALVTERVVLSPRVELLDIKEAQTSSGKVQWLPIVRLDLYAYRGTEEMLLATTVGQGQDTSDKGISKAITSAKKQALLIAFMVPTGDDTEAYTHEDSVTTRPTNGQQHAAPTHSAQPANKGQVMGWIAEAGKARGMGLTQIDDKARELGVDRSTGTVADLQRLLRAIEQPAQVPDAAPGSDPVPATTPQESTPSGDAGSSTRATPPAATTAVEAGHLTSEVPAADEASTAEPTLEDVLAVTGGEELPPEHGSEGYAEWFHQQPREKRMELQAQKLGPTDKPKRKTAPDPEPISAGLA